MQIQVNTDDNVQGRDALSRRVQAEINNTLGRFSSQITRIEVHLSDLNAGRSGGNDKRCLMEARLAGRKPEAVSHEAGTLDEAFSEAARKLRRSLESTLGRLNEQKGAETIRRGGSF